MKESIDSSINAILESYEKYGGINLDESNNFPNRQIKVVQAHINLNFKLVI